MFIVIIDNDPAGRATLLGRTLEAIRQAEVKRLEPVELALVQIESFDISQVAGCIIGHSLAPHISNVIEQLRTHLINVPIGLTLENDTYLTEAVQIRKNCNISVMPLGDLAQLVGFILECDSRASERTAAHRSRGAIGIAQLKGGVGCTTLTAALGACWARHGLTVVLCDFDDVNPQLSDWARVGMNQRTVTSEFLRQGEVPLPRINEMLHPVEGFEGRLVVVGQPDRYTESFHFKADVLEGAPSASEFVTSLIQGLQSEFDVVLVDMSRTWGIASYALLPLCQHILLVTDDDGMSVRRTLDGLQRLRRESDDPEEFDLSRWSLVLNAFTGRLISPRDLAGEIRDMDLFPPESNLFTVPFSEKGRQWGAPGQSLYEMAEDKTRFVIRKIAYTLVPFRFEQTEEAGISKFLKKLQSLRGGGAGPTP